MSVKAASRVKEIVSELSELRLADLGNKGKAEASLAELTDCLSQVSSFAHMIQGVVGHAAAASTGRTRAKGRRPGVRGPGRRGPGEFNATPFILSCVQESGKTGIRPREIVAKVQTVAPGHHVRPSALVSTILTRLKKRGAVRRRTGKWFPA